MAYRAIGNYTEANTAYEKALQIWRQDGNLSWQASLLNNMSILYQFQGEYEKAALAFEEGMLCAQRSHYARMEALIAIGLGDLYSELEDFDVAQQNYQHAAEVIQNMNDRFLLHSLNLARVNMALLQGNPADARKMIAKTTESIDASKSQYERGLLNLANGRLYMLEGKPLQAIPKMEEAERFFLDDGRELEAASSRLWLATAYFQASHLTESRQKIKTILNGRGQIAHAIVVTTHQARNWLEGLQKDAEVGRLVRDLFTRANRLSVGIPTMRRQLHRSARIVQMPAPRLVIQAFGKALVSVSGKPLTLSDWQTQSVRDLFFFFLTRSKPLTKEQVGEVIWADVSEPSRLKLRFKNEVYRLRRAVGQEVIVFENALYSFNRSLDYEYDVEAFEAYLTNAKAMTNIQEQIELYQKTVDLVQGPYLEDIDADWTMLEREHLNQVYLSTLLTLAELYQKHAQPEKALMTCARAIGFESTLEAAYCLSMRVYHRIGDRVSITRTYKACEDAMQRRLGIPPSSETDELYRRLTA